MSTDIELYPRDQNDFSHHGYALDDISNDIVTWQLNAKFTLTFDYPMFSEHAGDLVAENIVRVPVPGGKAAFRIAQVIKSMGHLSITAYHVFWDLNDDFIADTNIVDKDGQGALDQIMRAANYPTGFKVLSTIGNVTNARLVRMSIINALMGTDDNTFLNRWGGEFDWQDFSFSVNPRLGKDRGVHFEYAHNLTGYEATKDSSGIITRLLPEGYNGLLLPELYVDSPKLGNYRKPKIGTKNYQDIKAIDETQATGNQEGAVPVQEAYELLRAAAGKEFSESHIDEAQWTYKLNVALLENTEEYKDLSITTTVLPGDTVTITHKLDGIDVKARLTGYTWRPSNHSYLTQTYDSTSRPDVAYSNLSSRVNEIKSQIELVDKVVIAKAANGMNSTGWGDQSPVDLNIAGKTGDVYYQTTAKGTIMWLFHDGQWNAETGDAFGTEVQKKVDATIADVAAADANLQVAKQDIADLQVKLKANDDTQAQLTKDLADNSALITKNKADVDATLDAVNKTMSQAQADTATAVKNADLAVANAQSAVDASGLATASAQSAVATANSTASEFGPVKQKADSAVASALSAQNDASAAVAQASSAAADSKDAKQIAGAVSQSYKTLTDGSTMTIAELQNGLAVKLTKDDLSGYATQTWTQNQIKMTADGISGSLSSVKSTVDGHTTSINDLQADSSGFKSQFTTVNDTLGKQTTDISTLQATSKELTTGFNTLTTDNGTNKNDISQLKQTATELNSTITTVQTQVQDSSVGTNLLTNSNFSSGLDHWVVNSGTNSDCKAVVTTDSDGDTCIHITGTGTSCGLWCGPVSFNQNQVTTGSVLAKGTGKLSLVGLEYRPTSNFGTISTESYSKVSSTAQASSSTNNFTVYFDPVNDVVDIYIKFVKLELGSHATDYSVSPLDTATVTAVSKLSQTVDGFSTTFAKQTDLQTVSTKTNTTANGLSAVVDVNGKIAAALSLSADGGGTVTIQGASLYVTAASHFDDASIQSAAIANLDAAKITSGSIAADRLATTNLNADNITSGSIDADRIATTALSATNITSGTLDVGKLTVENLSADLIASGTIDASKITVNNLSASNIIGGELNALLVNVTNLNADKITTGTLNAANVNVINLNASAIVAGTISGANLAINLNTGMVEFQKGRIHSNDNNIDINVDQKYISVTDSNNSVLLKGGSMTFTQPYAFDSDQTPYLTIDNVGSSQTHGRGAEIVGRDVLTVSVSGENNAFLSGAGIFTKNFSGISISKNYDTVVGGANRGVTIIGGAPYSIGMGMNSVPSIMVGYNKDGLAGGTRIDIEADYVQISSAWSKTTSSSPNVFVAADGALVRSTSASKYKTNIKRDRSTDLAERLLTLPTAHWLDKAAMERYASGEQKELPQTNFGLIAEDLEAAGIEDLVVRGPDGELEGIQYDRIAAALLPLLAQMKTEIDELKATA
ncbi:phage tail spike protein [Lacticaseibacillus paracasei]|uniref:phage tail spike protein n=1 Tax=Lacticaseibacillus paracasei TaxID=1597 RepID=UPI002FF98901